MKKRRYRPIIIKYIENAFTYEQLDAAIIKASKEDKQTVSAIVITALIILTIFAAAMVICHHKPTKAQESISLENNLQLNEVEQYHLSQGHNIKFVEDIF